MGEQKNLPDNVTIEEVYDNSNKKMGYKAIIQVTENDKITSPVFANQEGAIAWATEKNISLKP